MELKTNICAEESCKVSIIDETSVDNKGYLPEDADVVVKDRFKYSDTISIDLLQHNKHDKAELQTPVFTEHKDKVEKITLPVKFDGWFTVLHIVLPNREWFERELAKEKGSAISLYNTVYFSDGSSIFKYFNGIETECTLSEIVERNTEDTTISRTCNNYVSICFLNKCYISLCQKILNSKGFKYCSECSDKNDIDKDLIFRRDLVWMAINVIKYLVQFEQLAEAERIIERISGCNGLCKSEFTTISSGGCGCRK